MGTVVRSFEVDDVLGGAPSWKVMLGRGLRRRCPRCGGGDVFRTRWSLRERCPTCGYRFEREPGFRLGAWFVNFMVLEVVHFGLAMAFIAWLSTDPEASLLGPLAVVVVTSVAVPVAFFPYSRTIWSAIDLGMTPMELAEIVDAAEALEAAGPDGEVPDGQVPEAEGGDAEGGVAGTGDQ
jgi:uncharacterized protein (DUF983 family)